MCLWLFCSSVSYHQPMFLASISLCIIWTISGRKHGFIPPLSHNICNQQWITIPLPILHSLIVLTAMPRPVSTPCPSQHHLNISDASWTWWFSECWPCHDAIAQTDFSSDTIQICPQTSTFRARKQKTERPCRPTSGEYIVAHTMELSPLMVRGPKGAIWDRRHYQNQDERGGVFTSTRAN